jgi:NNP family nitrate/nitrite transporter-like MFS transporter
VPGKKYLTIACGVVQGLFSVGLGLYIDSHPHPSREFGPQFITDSLTATILVAVIIVIFVILALFNEVANGVNFSLVPHCNPSPCSMYRIAYFHD